MLTFWIYFDDNVTPANKTDGYLYFRAQVGCEAPPPGFTRAINVGLQLGAISEVTSASGVVPEPSSLVMLAFGALAIRIYRRRSQPNAYFY
ncbi:MAG TPA: PEP-CTERM sorting domain-containing protein [Candidatus Brocadiia bacterium]|nr:PEP-CTERM sorting domain-containing protein [Candidatus Brocadiia bacterium]